MFPRITRRRLLALVAGGALFGGFRYGHRRIARPAPPSEPLSTNARELIARAWQGLDPSKVIDVHTHVVGLGRGGTGCQVAERMQSPLSPLEYVKFTVYLEAAGITDLDRADQEYIERLAGFARAQSPRGRWLLLAFDKAHDEQGQVLTADTEFYTPNTYVLELARQHPDVFLACASVHPYREDAVAALEEAALGGAVAVKWLPNAMNIDASHPRCDPFYDALARLRLPLITHTGEEKAVHAAERQRLGNPLLFRRALERGVTVVMSHCASLGQNVDLDAPEPRPEVENFDLFLRLMRERQWEGRLFGEISAVTQVNRLGTPLATLLVDEALQGRLVNGSDYPLPAINVLMQTRAVVDAGFLSEEERGLLNEIDQHNPLLFDFVLKRTLRLRRDGRDFRFADQVFTRAGELLRPFVP